MKDPGGITFIKVSFSPKWVNLLLQKYANNKLKLLSDPNLPGNVQGTDSNMLQKYL